MMNLRKDKKFQRVLSILLSLFLIVGILPMAIAAQDATYPGVGGAVLEDLYNPDYGDCEDDDEHYTQENDYAEYLYSTSGYITIVPLSERPANSATVTVTGISNPAVPSSAPWRLYSDGTLVVDSGTIHGSGGQASLWHAHRANINYIIFTGPITPIATPVGGINLNATFAALNNVTHIRGLEYFDTSNVVSMHSMFWGTGSLEYLDLSSWDTGSVTNLGSMFLDANSLVSLDVSTWNTSNVTNFSGLFQFNNSLVDLDISSWDVSSGVNMNNVFSGASSLERLDLSNWNMNSGRNPHHSIPDFYGAWFMHNFFHNTNLRELVLSEDFEFVFWIGDGIPGTPALPNLASNVPYTGFWVKVEDGTIKTSQELMTEPDPSIRAGTWIRERRFEVSYELAPLPPNAPNNLPVPQLPAPNRYGHSVGATNTNQYLVETVTVADLPTPSYVPGDGGNWSFRWTTTSSGVTDSNLVDGTFQMPANDVLIVGVWEWVPSEIATPPPDDPPTEYPSNGGNNQGGGDGRGSWVGSIRPITRPPVEQPPTEAPAESVLVRHLYLIGYEDGLIRPRGNITRAEVATIFFRLISDSDRAHYWMQENPFDDVVLDDWFNNAVSTTVNMGIFQGVSADRFEPHRNITRGELAAVMTRFFVNGGGQAASGSDNQFNDIAGHWARGYINTAAVNGWVRGHEGLGGSFNPNQAITRAEVAAMINRIFERLQERPEDLLANMIRWSDNMNESAWYYLYIQSASNSYTFVWKDGGIYELWRGLITPRDWTVLERPYSRPGDIR